MTIDTTDSPILKQIERLPLCEDIKQIRGSVKLSLHAEKLTEQKAEVEKIYAAEIKEERTFSKQDIAKLIILFAMANKLELDDLKVTEIVRDKQGTLLTLEVRIPNDDGGYQIINYTLKGRYRNGPKSYQNGKTGLDRSFWDKDGNFEGANNIAEYIEGKWCFLS